MRRWIGKYRGQVVGPGSASEPAGSLVVKVPEVMGPTGSQLALPCFPYAAMAAGSFVVPPKDAAVWVEFEGGKETKPIWVGGFYPNALGPKKATAAPAGTEMVLIQTTKDNVLSITDVAGPNGGIVLSVASGATITLNDNGVEIKDGKGGIISLSNGTVSINPPNLVVQK